MKSRIVVVYNIRDAARGQEPLQCGREVRNELLLDHDGVVPPRRPQLPQPAYNTRRHVRSVAAATPVSGHEVAVVEQGAECALDAVSAEDIGVLERAVSAARPLATI